MKFPESVDQISVKVCNIRRSGRVGADVVIKHVIAGSGTVHINAEAVVARDDVSLVGRSTTNRGAGSAIDIESVTTIADLTGTCGIQPDIVAFDLQIAARRIDAVGGIATDDIPPGSSLNYRR